MFYGRIVGTVVCTKKDKSLIGLKLLVVQKVNFDCEDEGTPIIAVDTVQAGNGDFVLLAKGKESSLPLGDLLHPVDASVIGIIDKTCISKTDSKEW